jgi:hypothetical protein
MLMVKQSPEVKALCREEPVVWREPFRENRDALAFLAENAAGCSFPTPTQATRCRGFAPAFQAS